MMEDWQAQQQLEEQEKFENYMNLAVINPKIKSEKKQMASEYQYPMIMICGESGSGKSTSLRNLDPNKTIIINTERKVLPFKKAKDFKMQAVVRNIEHFDNSLNNAIANENANCIVIDSFTSLAEMVYEENVRNEKKAGDGSFSSWSGYKHCLHDILLKCKSVGKFVIFLAIDEITQDENLRMSRTVSVQGSLKGKIEKEFEIVLWTHIDDSALSQSDRYQFITNSDGKNKAKTPMEMYDELYISNDLQSVLQTVFEYFNDEKLLEEVA